jgi:PAS domain S-box-containing protein
MKEISHALYRSLFENMLNGFAYCRMIFEGSRPVDFVYLSVNRAFGELTGLQGVVGKKVSEVIPGIQKSNPDLIATYGRVASTGTPETCETYLPSLDMWFAITVYSLETGYFVAVFDVITERKRLEANLKKAAGDWESTFNSIKDAIAIIDAGHHVIRVNQAFADLAKMPANQILGRHCFELMHGTDIPISNCPHACTLSTMKTESAEFLEPRLDKYFEVTTSPIFNDDGRCAGSVHVMKDITERKNAQIRIESALAEKELLLKEIHHRVKNNMQVISSLLRLQSQFVADEATRQMLKESQDRIKAMSLVYNKLYDSPDMAHIGFKEYVAELVGDLVRAYAISPGKISVNVNIADLTFDLDTAIPVGLIINELVTNALKYAFPDGRSGVIHVWLQPSDGKYILSVRDNGVGLPDGFDPLGGRSLGMKLVIGLAEHQLSGKLTTKRDGGSEFRVIF